MLLHVILYDKDEDFKKMCAGEIEKAVESLDVSLRLKLCAEQEEVLRCSEEGTVDLICLPLGGTSDGMDTAHSLRRSGYGGEIIFLAEGYGEVLDSFTICPADYIEKKLVGTDKFIRSLCRCCIGIPNADAHLIQCRRNGLIRGITVGSFQYFKREGGVISGTTPDGTGEIYLSWEELKEEVKNDHFICVGDTDIIHMSAVCKIKNNRITLWHGTWFPADDELIKTAQRALYRYLNEDFPKDKGCAYES